MDCDLKGDLEEKTNIYLASEFFHRIVGKKSTKSKHFLKTSVVAEGILKQKAFPSIRSM